MGVRLIAVDIDGTLLNRRGEVPPANRCAIREALDAGIEVVLATGRAFHHAKPIADTLSNRIVLITSNGALTKRLDGTTLACRLLPRATARAIIAATRPIRRGAALVFDRLDAPPYIFEGIDWQHPNRRRYYERNFQFMLEIDPLEDALSEDPVQVAFSGSVTEMRALAAEVRKLPSAAEVAIILTEYTDRDFSLLDLIAVGWSKGAALATWSAKLGLDRLDVMAVGDNLNDREMLEFAGHPVIMGNAVLALKAFGWPSTATHDEGGLADAIHSVALSQTS